MIDDHPDAVHAQWAQRLETAYREHRDQIISLLRRKFAGPAIEDAMQEIFVQFLRFMPGTAVKREITITPSYIYTCVRRRILRTLEIEQHHRLSTIKACGRGAIEPSHLVASSSGRVHNTENSFDADQLARAIDRLTPKQQQVMRLVCAENIRQADGARSLDCDENNFGVLKHRAINALRVALIADKRRSERMSKQHDRVQRKVHPLDCKVASKQICT